MKNCLALLKNKFPFERILLFSKNAFSKVRVLCMQKKKSSIKFSNSQMGVILWKNFFHVFLCFKEKIFFFSVDKVFFNLIIYPFQLPSWLILIHWMILSKENFKIVQWLLFEIELMFFIVKKYLFSAKFPINW